MNKKEAQKRIEAAERELEAAKKALQECEELRVPESIGFVGDILSGSFGLTFNGGKSRLTYSDTHGGIPVVWHTQPRLFDSPKLVKVDKPEKGKWYLAFNHCGLSDVVDQKYFYRLYTSEGEYWFIDDDHSIVRGVHKFNHYYELR